MSIIFKHITLIDGTGCMPRQDCCVVVEKDKIVHVGASDGIEAAPEDTVIDVSGKWMMPGLINMHEHFGFGHLYGPPVELLKRHPVRLALNARTLAAYRLENGITTVREMGSPHDIGPGTREAIEAGDCIGPRVLVCGNPISATGGHFSQLAVVVDGADNARKAARTLLAKGVDFIKVMASHDPYPMPGPEKTRAEMSFAEIAAVFEEAHQWGKKTACHCLGSGAIRTVVEAGVDVLDHGAYLTPELAEMMVERNVYYTPTLSSYTRQTISERYQRGEAWRKAHEPLIDAFFKAFTTALEAGVRMVVGTDTAGEYMQEVELFREYGMSPMESLLACTKNSAEALGMADKIGTVEEGKLADLILLTKDPLLDANNLGSVCFVMKGGSIVRHDS